MADLFTAAGVAFVAMVVAEAGDKTQLALITLAARHRAGPVLLGAVLGFTLLAALAVAVGEAAAHVLPPRLVQVAAAILFIAYGAYAFWRSFGHDEIVETSLPRRSAFLASFLLIAVLEFGDKTQLAVLALAARFAPLPVLVGSVAGFALLSALAVGAGAFLRERVGLARIERIGAVAFIIIGVLLLFL